jgi:hypothetical protein
LTGEEELLPVTPTDTGKNRLQVLCTSPLFEAVASTVYAATLNTKKMFLVIDLF